MKNRARIEILDKELKAYNRRDADEFCCYYSDSVEIIEQKTGNILMRGLDEVHKKYAEYFSKHPQLKCEVLSRIEQGDIVIDQERITGREDFPDGLNAIVIYHFNEKNLISKVWIIN